MKKHVLFILFLVLFLPFVVNAKEYCLVISGNGKDIGSEIACGNEHFYILSSNENEIRMLSKYNLNVGDSILKIKIVKEQGDNRSDEQYCSDIAFLNGGKVKSDGYYNTTGYCYVSAPLYDVVYYKIEIHPGETVDYRNCDSYLNELNQNNDNLYVHYGSQEIQGEYVCRYSRNKETMQSADAISAHWDDNDNYLYPQVGDVYLGKETHLNYTYDSYEMHDFEDDANSADYGGFFRDQIVRLEEENVDPPQGLLRIIKPSYLGIYLNKYKDVLNNNGFTINNIDIMSLNDINQIALKNNKSLPYNEWQYNIINGNDSIGNHHEFGFLNNYLLKEHNWLYNTTYWLRTGYEAGSVTDNSFAVMFVTSVGGVCGSPISNTGYFDGGCDSYAKTKLGCGVRPVITIPNELMYLIRTVTDGNGTIEVVDNSLGGKVIQFRVNAKKGYRLSKLIITTDSGEKIEFDTGEIINNFDGTISIDKNKFTMPFENVTMEARWVSTIVNPETGRSLIFLGGLLLIGILIVKGFFNKDKNMI